MAVPRGLIRDLTKTQRGLLQTVHELPSCFFRRLVTVSDDFTLRTETRQFILLMADEKVNKS